jgi:hypothetical protein
MLYGYIKMHGQQNIKSVILVFLMSHFDYEKGKRRIQHILQVSIMLRWADGILLGINIIA